MTEPRDEAGPPDDAPVQPDDAPAQPPQWQERDAWTALDDLDVSPALVPASEWPAGLAAAGVTSGDRPGLYAWWVDEAGAADLTRGLAPGRDLTVAPGRIHLGQAGATKWPSGRANDDTLGRRIGEVHLGGRVRMSTFRWSLAAILFDQLELREETDAAQMYAQDGRAARRHQTGGPQDRPVAAQRNDKVGLGYVNFITELFEVARHLVRRRRD